MQRFAKWQLTLSIVVLVSIAGIGLVPASARQDAVATVLVTAGSVTIVPVDGSAEYELVVDEGAIVSVGDVLTVSDPGDAVLTFFEGAETRLGPGSEAIVDSLSVEETTVQVSLTLNAGQAMSSVASDMMGESRFWVNTPAATVSVRGTEFIVFSRENQLTQVATVEGTVVVEAQGQESEVPCGYGLKLLPGEKPGELKVWGQSTVALTAPVGDVEGVPITYINRDNGQRFFFRTGDRMMVVLGNYDLVVNTPAPYRMSGIEFGEDLEPEQIVPFEIAMSGMILNLIDEGHISNEADHVYLRLLRADGLAAESVVTPGEPFIVGPGVWSIEAALDDTFERSQQLELDIAEGSTAMIPLDLAGFAP